MHTNKRRALLGLARAGAMLSIAPAVARAASKDPLPRTKEYIVALVRSNPGVNPKERPTQRIEPQIMKADAKSAPGNALVFDHFVGDLHLRYVFDDPQFMLALRARDLARLGIARDALPALVVENFRRLYPKVTVFRPEPALGIVTQGGQLEPCTMLDGAFWERQRREFGGDLIATVPARDAVIFTTRAPRQNVELLKHLAVQAYEKADKAAVSRTVFAWVNYRWQVVA
jgi:uncharacterized protein YtpQ (UPF0354 family)